jgi:hypothetical protein
MKIKKCPLGKIHYVKRFCKTFESQVWKIRFEHKFKHHVLKTISLKNTAVYVKLAWKKAGFLKPPKKLLKVKSKFFKEYSEYRHRLQKDDKHTVHRIKRCWEPWKKDGATKIVNSNEYFHEVMIMKVLNKYANVHLPVDVFCKKVLSWNTFLYGNIVMEHGGYDFEKCAPLFNLLQLKSLVFQLLIALSWAQEKLYFKHHDLHIGNIFIKKQKIPQIWRLPNGTEVNIPCTEYKLTIADFGFSAVTDPVSKKRYGRVDYCLLNDNVRKWGQFNANYEGNEGYDLVYVLGNIYDYVFHKTCKDWIKDLVNILKRDNYIKVSHKTGRPLTKVSFTAQNLMIEILASGQLQAPQTDPVLGS